MEAKLESKDIYEKLNKLMSGSADTENVSKEKLEKLLKDNDSNKEVDEQKQKKLEELMDGKVTNAFEKLRNDNLYIWKQSLELAQNEFNEKGVAQTMSFLPKVLLDKNDLKRTVNSLILEDNDMPKASLK